MSCVSSENSGITTAMKTLSPHAEPVDYCKELSVTFCKIQFLLQADFSQRESTEQFAVVANEFYYLALRALQLLDECPRLLADFNYFYSNKLPEIFAKLLVNSHVCGLLYSLRKDANIEMFWALFKVVRLLYGSRLYCVCESDSRLNGTLCPFRVSIDCSIALLRNLQIALFKYSRSEELGEDQNALDEIAKPCAFFRGPLKSAFIIDEKLKLLHATLETLLLNVDLDIALFIHLQDILTNRPLNFSLDLFQAQFQVLSSRLDEIEWMVGLDEMKMARNNLTEVLQEYGQAVPAKPTLPAVPEEETAVKHAIIPPLNENIIPYIGPKSRKRKRYIPNWEATYRTGCPQFIDEGSDESVSLPRIVPGFRARVKHWVTAKVHK